MNKKVLVLLMFLSFGLMATDPGGGAGLSRHEVEESEMVTRVGDIVTVHPRGVSAFFRIKAVSRN
jgi:hypothetical protein